MSSSDARDQALRALAARGDDDAITLTRRWVEQNSYTENVAGTDAVGAMLADAFALKSLSHEAISSPRFAAHHVWRTPAARAPGARSLLLIGHHDTVFPPGHFEGWKEEGGKAIGPGSLDMKGGLAIVRSALAALEDAGLLAALPLIVVSVSDEEVGSPDSAPHLKAIAQGARGALVFESGRAQDLIVTRRKGTGAIVAVATGKAAHAGNAHPEGKNAIWAIARFVDAAQRLTAYERGVTVNVGLISGGTSKNTVPAEARAQLDLRFETTADAHALVAALRTAAAEAQAAVPGTAIHLEGGPNRLPLERTAESAALLEAYAACQRDEGLGDGESPLCGGGSDANTVAAVGVPAIDGLGPRGQGFHTLKEFVELASFAPKTRALVRFLTR